MNINKRHMIRTVLIVGLTLIIAGCNPIQRITEQTNCNVSEIGYDPLNTAIHITIKVKVNSAKDSRFHILPEGVYYPVSEWMNCEMVYYLAPVKIETGADNKLNHFFEAGYEKGGVMFKTSDPYNIYRVWHYFQGYVLLEPANIEDIEFEIIGQLPPKKESTYAVNLD